jgi:hypothetical protein
MYKYQLYLILSSRNRNDGFALVTTVICTVFGMLLLSSYMLAAMGIKDNSIGNTRSVNSFYAATNALALRRQDAVDLLSANPDAFRGLAQARDEIATCLPGATQVNVAPAECRNFRTYSKSATDFASGSATGTYLPTAPDEYGGYSIVTDRTNYLDYANNRVAWTRLPASDTYGNAIARVNLYRVSSIGYLTNNNGNTTAQTVFKSDIEMRQLPIFQFQRFAFGDDTIVLNNPGTGTQILGGKYHINGDLRLVRRNNTQDVLARSWTVGGRFYLGLTGISGVPGQPAYMDTANGYSLLPAESASPLAASYLNNYVDVLRTRDTGISPLKVPSRELLRQKDKDGNIGNLYGTADLRIKAIASANQILNVKVESIQTDPGSQGTNAACAGMSLSTDRENYSSSKCQDFTKGMLASMHRPVLFMARGNASEGAKYCPNLAATIPAPIMTTFSTAVQDKILQALALAMSADNLPSNLLVANRELTPTDPYMVPIRSRFSQLLSLISSLSATERSSILSYPLQEIAAARRSCFVAPPIQRIERFRNYSDMFAPTTSMDANNGSPSALHDRRKNQAMNAIQVNLESLAIWNRDGVFVEFPSQNLDTFETVTPAVLINAFNNPSTSSTDGLAYVRSAIDPTVPNSLAASGLGAVNITEGGLIVYAGIDESTNTFTIDPTSLAKNYSTAPAIASTVQATIKLNDTVYAFNGGSRLPAPLSIVTDRGAYVQGDWNTIAKMPAAVMADTLTLLSNACLSDDVTPYQSYPVGNVGFYPSGVINCARSSGISIAADTQFNSAILSAITPIGTNNIDSYPIRYLEDWSNKNLTGLTAVAITGAPLEDSSIFVPPGTGAYNAAEYFRYPTLGLGYDPGFNDPQGLPPSTPMAVDLGTKRIDRKYSPTQEDNFTRFGT